MSSHADIDGNAPTKGSLVQWAEPRFDHDIEQPMSSNDAVMRAIVEELRKRAA